MKIFSFEKWPREIGIYPKKYPLISKHRFSIGQDLRIYTQSYLKKKLYPIASALNCNLVL